MLSLSRGHSLVRMFLAMGPRGLWRAYRVYYDNGRSARDREKGDEWCSPSTLMVEILRLSDRSEGDLEAPLLVGLEL